MLNKPEEFIMAVLAGIWVAITFIICRYLQLPTDTGLLVTTLTLIWALVFFLLWQRGRTSNIWPVFLGLLVMCWWRAIYYSSTEIILNNDNSTSTLVHWYGSWTALIIYALIPLIAGYGFKWWQHKRRKPQQPV
ncbi:MAG: hypothetical protein J6578_05305 [Snodgrassella sp.]|jgi:hypothetical protein|uniref:Uncharacterized protein n=2 Tax=Snodgrassella TaxID=1193515 RepID=A0A066TMB0_9NEIS|nr:MULTISPECIES: hypothetical protein [Snodgrassella]KDN13178.1 hypothetical protein SALWKB12_0033 [Snodgrassella communis]KDN14415.1 hypothetical protein SALWKB29_1504 [Snodgrassella communis]MCO6506381.1 hypothetical protein [Snodgrassella sp.]MCO6508197.1 hypothetical protein [Snodgrassella sp.]MCO6513423.1 hypothetical protein [Snodgrassella sp.]